MCPSGRRLPRQLAAQLTCQSQSNAGPQALAERWIEVAGQSDAVIADRNRNCSGVAQNELQADHPVGRIGIGVSAGIQDQLVDNQCDKDGAVCGELDFPGCVKLDPGGRDCGLQILDDFPQVGDQIYVLIVGIVRETTVSSADRRDPGGCFHEPFAQCGIAGGARLQVKHARDDLQAVLDPVVDLLQQDLMTVQCGLQLALI